MVEALVSLSPFCHLLGIRGSSLGQGNAISARIFQNETVALSCPQRGERNPGGDGEDSFGGCSSQGVTAEGDACGDIKQGL